MGNTHNWPQGFMLAFAFVVLVLGIPHLFGIIFKDLGRLSVNGGQRLNSGGHSLYPHTPLVASSSDSSESLA